MTLLFAVLIGRIFWVQVVRGDFWLHKAEARWSASETLKAKRGNITDRDGNILAMDTLAYTVAVEPDRINKLGDQEEVIQGLHNILNKPENEIEALVTAKDENGKYYVQREVRPEGWKIDKTTADKITALNDQIKEKTGQKDNGILLINDEKRYYPKQTMASQLLGYMSKEGQPMTGIESYFNDQLKGENGEFKYMKDGKQVQLSKGEVDYTPAKDGQDIKLTIDSMIQNYVEEAIKEVYDKYQPKSITAIAADPNTMEILAMANMPTYNPNDYWNYGFENYYNHATKSLYEPGSTFKIVTLAASVQEGLFNPNATYPSGSIQIPGSKPIRDINRNGWGTITYLEGLKRSSNVAFVRLEQALGAQKLHDYVMNFGFGQKTGIALGSELAGNANFNAKNARDSASAAFGQGVSVTPIQQVAAVAAVANGGKLLQPQIVKEIYDPNTKTTQKFEPKLVRQVISPETSKQVGEYLEQVVSDAKIGTGHGAYIEGYRIAGKTGTAQKAVKGGGGYSADKFVVSFIGYAPVENPKIVVYIVVDEPNDSTAGGGKVAAPAFQEIMYKSLRYMGIAPTVTPNKDDANAKEDNITVPDVSNLTVANAESRLKDKSLTYEAVGKGDKVLRQIPAAGSAVHASQTIYLITEQQDKLQIPDLKGASLRDAVEMASILGIRLETQGEGYVVSQSEDTPNGQRVLKLVLQPLGGPDEEDADTDESGSAAGEEGGASDGSASADNGDSGSTGGSADNGSSSNADGTADSGSSGSTAGNTAAPLD
ncbi:PASTA domain-containing penicillin-binding protein [Paenibacillus protaetiae]|nr:PASTA domain-containing penicillin-binding protein [Paenibacillus protaetiae]